MVERLRQRSAKPVPVGSTPTHASIFELKRLIRGAFFYTPKVCNMEGNRGWAYKMGGQVCQNNNKGFDRLVPVQTV